MLKKEVNYITFEETDIADEFKEKEVTEKKYFLFSLAAMKTYEEVTGRDFYDDFSKASTRLFSILKISGVEIGEENEDVKMDVLEAMAILTDPLINNFLIDAVPALYGEVKGPALLQNAVTFEKAAEAPWAAELLSADTFMEFFQEISGGKLMNMKKKPENQAEKLEV